MQISYIPFKPWHLKLFKPGRHYESPVLDKEFKASLYRQIEGTTLLINGEIAAILGVATMWEGVGEVTLVPSDLFYKHIKTCIKECRNLLEVAALSCDLSRIQAATLKDQVKHGRFLLALGFKLETPEGMAGFFGHGRDANMYAYVPKGLSNG
jgi:hypothetical protein